jgi:uncharacterized damage-inducible protein DinB
MVTPAYVQRMARYNRWQNENLYGAAGRLPDSERTRERGAFFGSIHGTLAHLLWGDLTWMRRFHPNGPAAPPRPSNTGFTNLWPDWVDLCTRRAGCDGDIANWADQLTADWLATDLTWTSSDGSRTSTAPKAMLVAHFFNHQTHHRGQVHCMLTQAGIKPSDTDLMLMER